MSYFGQKQLEIWQASDVTPKATGEVCLNTVVTIAPANRHNATNAAAPNAPGNDAQQRRDREGAHLPQPEIPTVSAWVTNNLGFTPDPTQADVLDATEDSILLLCTRQWGKSTIAAAKALHHALTKQNAFIIAASACKRQSAELVRKFREFAGMIGLKIKRDGEGFTLPNGARIIPVPQSPAKVRCYSAPSLIIIDEAAFVDDEMFEAVTPMLATSNGTLWLMSTPTVNAASSTKHGTTARTNGKSSRRPRTTARASAFTSWPANAPPKAKRSTAANISASSSPVTSNS